MSLRNLIEFVLLSALWGASFLFLRVATPEFGAWALIEIRIVIAVLFLLPIWIVREAKTAKTSLWPNWFPIAVVGVINSAIPWVLFAYATLYITGGYASILNATVPIWGALVAWMWLGKKPGFDSSMGLVVGILGVVILVWGSLNSLTMDISLGIAAGLIGSVLYGVAANYSGAKLSNVPPLTISTFSLVAAAIILLPLAIIYYPTQEISTDAWLAVLAMAVLSTGFALILYFRLIANIGAGKAMTVTFLIPVFGTLFGAVFLYEKVTMEMIIGTLVILTGTALVMGVVRLRG